MTAASVKCRSFEPVHLSRRFGGGSRSTMRSSNTLLQLQFLTVKAPLKSSHFWFSVLFHFHKTVFLSDIRPCQHLASKSEFVLQTLQQPFLMFVPVRQNNKPVKLVSPVDTFAVHRCILRIRQRGRG